MKTLFPEIEKEISDDRKAMRRERAQRGRDYLRNRDISWTINQLLEHGPCTEVALMFEVMDEEGSLVKGMAVLVDLYWLWVVGKLWRTSVGIHSGSGEMSFIYGIRKVHPRNKKTP